MLEALTTQLEYTRQIAGILTVLLSGMNLGVLLAATLFLTPPQTQGIYYIRNLFLSIAIYVLVTLLTGVLGATSYDGALWVCLYVLKLPAIFYMLLASVNCFWFFGKDAIKHYWERFILGR